MIHSAINLDPITGTSNVADITPSPRLSEVRYEIRGPLARRARALEAAGRDIIYMNIGNPGRFGFRAPEHLVEAVASHLSQSDAYCQEEGLAEARAAVVEEQRARGITDLDADHVFMGNGVSELIDVSLRALLKPGDEVLLPSPDYPLWSAATILNGGTPRYYDCLATADNLPDPEQLAAQVNEHTRAIVLINPNNPTGAVYPKALLERVVAIAREHDLMLLCDEIYDGITYDDAVYHSVAALAGDVPCATYNGLSKVHRACGFRVGWLTLSGDNQALADYRDSIQLLAALRLCPNVPAQWAVAPSFQGADTISALTAPGGRLYQARQAVSEGVAASQYLDMIAPQGALYAFPWVREDAIADFDDNAFALKLLEDESVLLAPGSSFNATDNRHFRLTLLPEPEQITEVFARIERVLSQW